MAAAATVVIAALRLRMPALVDVSTTAAAAPPLLLVLLVLPVLPVLLLPAVAAAVVVVDLTPLHARQLQGCRADQAAPHLRVRHQRCQLLGWQSSGTVVERNNKRGVKQMRKQVPHMRAAAGRGRRHMRAEAKKELCSRRSHSQT